VTLSELRITNCNHESTRRSTINHPQPVYSASMAAPNRRNSIAALFRLSIALSSPPLTPRWAYSCRINTGVVQWCHTLFAPQALTLCSHAFRHKLPTADHDLFFVSHNISSCSVENSHRRFGGMLFIICGSKCNPVGQCQGTYRGWQGRNREENQVRAERK
jgi:hypothetical protein